MRLRSVMGTQELDTTGDLSCVGARLMASAAFATLKRVRWAEIWASARTV